MQYYLAGVTGESGKQDSPFQMRVQQKVPL